MQQSQQQSHVPPNTIVKPPSLPQMLNPSLHQQMQSQQDRSRQASVCVLFNINSMSIFDLVVLFYLILYKIFTLNLFVKFVNSINYRTI